MDGTAHLIPSTYQGLSALNKSVRLFTSTAVANFVLKRFFWFILIGTRDNTAEKQMIMVVNLLCLGKQAAE